MDVSGKRIFVGLSGGVDSAVSAARLKEEGAAVTGVFLKGWYPPGMPCTWAEERRDAMRVAARLRIPFITLEAGAEYKKSVIEYLLSEYKAGRTPNPDVMCNRDIKFGVFHRFAKSQGADAIATGHYRAGEKDQTYFLWAVPKDILAETIFPVGHMDKKDVRKLAEHFRLPVAEKRDSQGVCFLGSVSVDDFLRAEFGTNPGHAVDESGHAVGAHDGVLLHTVGERVALSRAPEGPWYVVAKHIEKNELVVARSRSRGATAGHEFRFTSANWHGDPAAATEAQYRYRGPRIAGKINGERFIATQALPEALTEGQSAVFYGENGLVGGGIIAA